LPLWELIGAFLGILAGVTFGERASPLNPLGDVYAMMLLSVVYPYILGSLIVGLGSLRRSCRQAGALWATVFATIFVLSQAVPPFEIEPPHPIAVNDHPGQSRPRA
jgi:Na+/H+-dicarboxylate symporter